MQKRLQNNQNKKKAYRRHIIKMKAKEALLLQHSLTWSGKQPRLLTFIFTFSDKNQIQNLLTPLVFQTVSKNHARANYLLKSSRNLLCRTIKPIGAQHQKRNPLAKNFEIFIAFFDIIA